MKRILVSVTCALVVISSLSVAAGNTKLGMFGVDVVSAATGAPTTTKPPTTKPATSKPSTTKPTTSKPGTVTTATKVTRMLALNSAGSDVKLLQTYLNNNGAKLKVDGFYGKLTLAAVKNFQKKNGLKNDGIVGTKTITKLAPVVATTTTTPAKPTTPTIPTIPAKPIDVVTSASVTDNAAVFEKSIGKDGKWIIATTKDLTFDKPLVLEGDFVKTGTTIVSRKIAPYTQTSTSPKQVIDRFTITAPKLTIKSPSAKLQSGIFKGDIYVTVPNFQLIDARVEGNVYFTTQAAKDGFVNDRSVITGDEILIELDAVTTASIVISEAAFEKALGTADMGGKWIIGTVRDLTFNKELVLKGEIYKTGTTPSSTSQRKIALYSQITNADKTKTVTRDFTLTAPKLTIQTPFARIQNGIFKGNLYITAETFTLLEADVIGDVYVSANNFKLDKAKVTGNVYFTSEEFINSATGLDSTSVSGVYEVK